MRRFSPFLSTAISIAPRKVPAIEPRPPERLVPPTTTAAITSSSYISPAFGWPEFIRDARSTPLAAESTPQSTYTPATIRPVLIPASRAASALPPTASTYRPNRVWRSATWAAA